MSKSKRVAIAGIMAAGMAAIGMAAVGVTSSAVAAGTGHPEVAAGDAKAGEQLFAQRCNGCHVLETVTALRATREEWHEIVERMVMNGAQVTEPEMEAIVSYLASAYGPEAAETTKS